MLKNPHAVALGRLGGLVSSPAKARAARENGKKGGRPKGARAEVFRRLNPEDVVIHEWALARRRPKR
jgi:hypothetical protein